MARNDAERDFTLKATTRSILWSQGYSTRLDVLLAYDMDPRGRSGSGKAGLTDLDVLGLRIDPSWRVYTAIADCKTSAGKIPERLFWLAGVARFFGSDSNLLVRSQSLPEHAVPLARSLNISLVAPDDLTILTNIYVNYPDRPLSEVWQNFFSPALLAEVLRKVLALPESLRDVSKYREALYWMEPAHTQLQKIPGALHRIARDGAKGSIVQLVFADFVWLYVVSLWRACEVLTRSGLSRLRQELEIYLNGDEASLQNLRRVQRSFQQLARRANVDASLPLLPSYFDDLHEVVVRCIRRPEALAKLARRAEWLLIGQMVGDLGGPPWERTESGAIADKLLGDIARFLVKASGLDAVDLDAYLGLLRDPEPTLIDPVITKDDETCLADLPSLASSEQAEQN